MNDLINKQSILDCNTNEEMTLHAQEIQFLQDYFANQDIPLTLKCVMENYEGSTLAEETISSTANGVLNVVENNFDYKSGLDVSIADNGNLQLEVYGGLKNVDGTPQQKKAIIELFTSVNKDENLKFREDFQNAFEEHFHQKELAKDEVQEQHHIYKKKTNAEKKQEVNEAFKQLQAGVDQMLKSDEYKKILDYIGKFRNYSFSNSILIQFQKPDSSYVASYTDWKTKFNRQVNKGERGIQIISPVPSTKQKEFYVLDPITKEKTLDEHGQPITETRTVKYMNYKVSYTFDISQTSPIPGKEVIELSPVHQLEGKVANYDDLLTAIKEVSPVPISFREIKKNANGYYNDSAKEIVVRDDLSEAQTLKTAIHELSHSMLHTEENIKETGDILLKRRQDQETQAESISYIVCNHYGLDTGNYSFGYVAGWASDTERVNKNLSIIQKTANEIITKMDASLERILKEKEETLSIENNHFEERSVVFSDKETALYVQSCDDGWDYTLIKDGKEFDGGIIENKDLSIDEAVLEAIKIQEISSPIANTYSFNIFESLNEMSEQIDINDSLNVASLTTKIDQFMQDYDIYNYQDFEQYPGSNFDETFQNVQHNSLQSTKEFLTSVIEDDRSMVQEAKDLLEEIEKYSNKYEVEHKEIEKEKSHTLKI